jgi:hypothetical protein
VGGPGAARVGPGSKCSGIVVARGAPSPRSHRLLRARRPLPCSSAGEQGEMPAPLSPCLALALPPPGARPLPSSFSVGEQRESWLGPERRKERWPPEARPPRCLGGKREHIFSLPLSSNAKCVCFVSPLLERELEMHGGTEEAKMHLHIVIGLNLRNWRNEVYYL